MGKIIPICATLLTTCKFIAAQQPAVNNGRYLLYQHPQFRGDTFILDTRTGKVFQLVKCKSGALIWQEMLFECYNNGKLSLSEYPQSNLE